MNLPQALGHFPLKSHSSPPSPQLQGLRVSPGQLGVAEEERAIAVADLENLWQNGGFHGEFMVETRGKP